MKVIMISGSRSPAGRTATMADALLRGATNAGAECERYFLPEMLVRRCRQCDEQGWGQCREQGTCVIEDDFAGLVEKIHRADGVVFASPVYFSDLSESLRAFLDRLRRITRHDAAKPGIAGKRAIAIAVAGGGGGGAPACIERMQTVLATCGFDVLDAVPARRQNLELKEQVLELTGQWLIKQLQE
jgi:multimeric flavodoxin WrbA